MEAKWFKGVGIAAAVAIMVMGMILAGGTHVVSAAALDGRGGPGGSGGQGAWGAQGGTAGQASTALTPLSDVEKDALQKAILEEYGAYNLYQSVIQQLGSAVPFNQILQSEQQHINVLVRAAQKYGVSVPQNIGLTAAPTFQTLQQACSAGVDAEMVDAALYDQLKPVTTHSDLLRIYSNLQSASLNNHLPAFQVCD